MCLCVCRFFCLTTDGLVYCKSKTDPPLCNIPAEDMLAVERVDENAFNMKHVGGGCGHCVVGVIIVWCSVFMIIVWWVWSLCSNVYAAVCVRVCVCVCADVPASSTW